MYCVSVVSLCVLFILSYFQLSCYYMVNKDEYTYSNEISVICRWLSGDALTRSDHRAAGLSLYDLAGPFLLLAVVVSVLLTTSVVRHCVRRRRSSVDRLPGAKLVTAA